MNSFVLWPRTAVAFAGLGLVFYLWTKTCQVLRQSLSATQDGWWIMKKFTAEDTARISFTETQFYYALLGVVRDDIVGIFTLIFDLSFFILEQIILSLSTVVIIISVLGLVLFGGFYFYNNKSLNKDPITKEKSKSQTRAEPSGVGTRTRKGVSTTPEQEETTDIWKRLGLLNKHKRYRRIIVGMMFFAFLLSIPWEYVRLYQTMVAEKVTQMTTGIPAECMPEQMSMTQSLKAWFRSQFSWSADPCLLYHKAILVDPMWQVPPLMVITSALSHCLIYPVEVFFSTLGRCLRLFFSEIPVQYQPVMLIIIVLMVLLVLIMLFGYRIRCPLLSFEPKKSVNVRLQNPCRANDNVLGSCDSSVDSSLNWSISPSMEAELFGSGDTRKRKGE